MSVCVSLVCVCELFLVCPVVCLCRRFFRNLTRSGFSYVPPPVKTMTAKALSGVAAGGKRGPLGRPRKTLLDERDWEAKTKHTMAALSASASATALGTSTALVRVSSTEELYVLVCVCCRDHVCVCVRVAPRGCATRIAR